MMKALVPKFLLPVILVVLSVIGGWQATYLIEMIPANMPHAVDAFIRFCLSITGHKELANPDDMAVLALILYWVGSAVLIGLVLYAGYAAIRRRLGRTSSQS